MLSVEYCEAHLIWSMDIFEQVHRGVRFHVLQVIDLGSRVKLEPAVKPGAFTAEEVAEHLNYMKHKHEAPLFLKRDNGSNLNSGEVLSILKMFAVIPFNSPPGFPQFNGVMERSQGEIKRYLRAILKDREELDIVATYNLSYNGSLLVEAGLGYGLCLDQILHVSGDSGLCFRPLEPPLEAELHVIWKKYQLLSKAAERFLQSLRVVCAAP